MGSRYRRLSTTLGLSLALAGLPACGDGGTPYAPPDGDPPPDSEPTFDLDGTWSQAASLPEALSWPGVASFRGHIYVAGGSVDQDVPTAAVHRYDPDADAWTRLSDLARAVTQAALVVHRNTLLLLGGHEGAPGRPRATALAYDPAADAWSEHSQMPEPRDEHGAASILDRIVVVGGGAGLQAQISGDSVAIYDSDGGWRRGPPPASDGILTGYGVLADTLFAVWAGSSAARLDAYHPAAAGWVGNRSTPVSSLASIGAPWRGRLHVLYRSGADRLHRAYDPAAGEWLTLPPMPVFVRNTRPVALGDRLYVIGGLDRELVRRPEVYAFSVP